LGRGEKSIFHSHIIIYISVSLS